MSACYETANTIGEWKLATEALGAANALAIGGFSTSCVSRAYYAILHASNAALAVRGIESASHKGVKRMFGLHLVRTHEIERKWADELSEALDDRNEADYDTDTTWSTEDANEECRRATRFLERIRDYLIKSGIPEGELLTVPPRPGRKPTQPGGDPERNPRDSSRKCKKRPRSTLQQRPAGWRVPTAAPAAGRWRRCARRSPRGLRRPRSATGGARRACPSPVTVPRTSP